MASASMNSNADRISFKLARADDSNSNTASKLLQPINQHVEAHPLPCLLYWRLSRILTQCLAVSEMTRYVLSEMLNYGDGRNCRTGNCRTGNCRTGHCMTGNCRTGHWLTLEYPAKRFCTEQRTYEDRVTSHQRLSGFVLTKQSTQEYKTAIFHLCYKHFSSIFYCAIFGHTCITLRSYLYWFVIVFY